MNDLCEVGFYQLRYRYPSLFAKQILSKIDEDGCKLKLCSQWLDKLSIVYGHGTYVQNFAISLNRINENVVARKYTKTCYFGLIRNPKNKIKTHIVFGLIFTKNSKAGEVL